MKKKKYTKPEISIFQIEAQAVLASVSEISVAPTELYNEENVKNLWERPERKTIWSD